MIQGLIKANSEGFKNASKQKGIENVILTVKSNKPTKFKKRQIAFDATHFKNPAPTPFATQQIKENSVYAAKEFNKLNYSEDPFQELFGYTKRINPDDNINPKFYEYKLGNKNENNFILENLQAENGTATKDVEQREALKDFLELRRLQEIDDLGGEDVIPILDATANKKRMKRALYKLRKKEKNKEADEGVGEEIAEGGLSTGVTTRRAKSSKKGSIAIEPAIKLGKLPPAVDKFKEFEDKTKVDNIKLIGGKVPVGDVPGEEELIDLLNKAGEYAAGKTKDRSAVIKINKYLKLFGIEPITGKEKTLDKALPKLKELAAKLNDAKAKEIFAKHASLQRDKLKKTSNFNTLKEEESMRARQQAITQLEDIIESKAKEHEWEEEEGYKALSAKKGGRTPRGDIRGFLRATDDEGALRELEKQLRRGKDLSGLQDEEKTLAKKTKGARFMARTLQDAKNRNSKGSAFDNWKGKIKEEKFKEKRAATNIQRAFREHQLSKDNVDINTAIDPEQAPAKDTKKYRESLGEPETPEHQKVLKDIVVTLRPIVNNIKLSRRRKLDPTYIPFINSLFQANEQLAQLGGGKAWRASSTTGRLEEVLDKIERMINGEPEPGKKGVGRPRAVAEVGGEAKIGEID